MAFDGFVTFCLILMCRPHVQGREEGGLPVRPDCLRPVLADGDETELGVWEVGREGGASENGWPVELLCFHEARVSSRC